MKKLKRKPPRKKTEMGSVALLRPGAGPHNNRSRDVAKKTERRRKHKHRTDW